MQTLTVAVVVLWVVVILLSFVVLALARQLGILHERSAPMGALMLDQGPLTGALFPSFALQTRDGRNFQLGAPTARSLLLLFVSADCPICKKIIPLAQSVASREKFDLLLCGDDSDGKLAAMTLSQHLEGIAFVNNSDLGRQLQVSKLPYAFLLNADATLAAKGLVNTREHVESLVLAKQTGFASAQQYLKSIRAPVAQ
jgi:methylamine dehydrogenase accessory protein MauD